MLDATPDRRNTIIRDRRAFPRVAVDTGELKERRKGGRPPRSGVAARPFMIRLTTTELARIAAAARVEQKPVADYCRDVLLSESEDLLDPER